MSSNSHIVRECFEEINADAEASFKREIKAKLQQLAAIQLEKQKLLATEAKVKEELKKLVHEPPLSVAMLEGLQ